MITDKDHKKFKDLIKASIKAAEDMNSSERSHLKTTQELKLNQNLISAYELALHVNFEPSLIRTFASAMAKYLGRYYSEIDKVT